ncbi:MFS transporter [Saccharopolyspora indica]|uniref:MFS transporter n=1 Tax=Saccharopolyspora indica TaxID=1229659 RepID=UPI0022EAC7D0|nr:MFS transporter [Saccharopolyspora indica]MDA3646799.1 MFS transporter [Saccharopolyspora indica]
MSQASAPPAEPTAPPKWEIWLAAWPITAVLALSNAATPLYVLWQREIGFSSGMLTVIYASYIAGLLGTLLVAGVASDRLGRKPVLVPAVALGVLSCLVFATATSVPALAVARLLTGVGVGAVVSAGMAAVTEVAGPSRTRLGSLLASTAMVLGAGLGPLLAGVLAEALPGPTVTVFALEALLLVTALLAVLRMPLPSKGNRTSTGPWIRLPSVPRENREHLLRGLAVFAPGITATGFVLSLGPSLLSDLLGSESRILAGGMAFVMFATATAVQFAVQQLPIRTILTAGAAATVASMAALMLAVHHSSIPPLVAAAMLAGAGQGLGQLGGLSMLSAEVPTARRAEANAAFNFGGYLPAGALPVAIGYLTDATNLTTGATTFALLMIAAATLGPLTTRPRN